MNRTRSILLVAVVVAVMGLIAMWDRPDGVVEVAGSRPSVDHVGFDDEVSSTWFCPATTAAVEPVPRHELYVSNTADQDSDVRISVYGPEGPGDVRTMSVGAHRTLVVDVDAEFGTGALSAMVEAPSGAIGVSQGIISKAIGDVSHCQRTSAPESYFPSQTTLSGTTAQLVLFNPFAADASVDVIAAVADGIRSPTEWAGIVVPAGTTRTVDLSEQVQRRDQFALTVRVRSGRVFTNTIQTYGGIEMGSDAKVSGLRISPPVTRARSSWTFAGGFTDAAAAELLVVQNPSREKVSVSIQVVPDGSVDLAPEPFEMSIPAGWYSTLDLSAEGRVPDFGFHSITVEADGDAQVVAQRQIRLSAPPDAGEEPGTSIRPVLGRGVAASTGVNGSAKVWWMTDGVVGGPNQPLLSIENPGDSSVQISIEAIGPDVEPVDVVVDEALAAGDSITLSLDDDDDAAARSMFRITASEPVVVERLVILDGVKDFSVGPAFPLDD